MEWSSVGDRPRMSTGSRSPPGGFTAAEFLASASTESSQRPQKTSLAYRYPGFPFYSTTRAFDDDRRRCEAVQARTSTDDSNSTSRSAKAAQASSTRTAAAGSSASLGSPFPRTSSSSRSHEPSPFPSRSTSNHDDDDDHHRINFRQDQYDSVQTDRIMHDDSNSASGEVGIWNRRIASTTAATDWSSPAAALLGDNGLTTTKTGGQDSRPVTAISTPIRRDHSSMTSTPSFELLSTWSSPQSASSSAWTLQTPDRSVSSTSSLYSTPVTPQSSSPLSHFYAFNHFLPDSASQGIGVVDENRPRSLDRLHLASPLARPFKSSPLVDSNFNHSTVDDECPFTSRNKLVRGLSEPLAKRARTPFDPFTFCPSFSSAFEPTRSTPFSSPSRTSSAARGHQQPGSPLAGRSRMHKSVVPISLSVATGILPPRTFPSRPSPSTCHFTPSASNSLESTTSDHYTSTRSLTLPLTSSSSPWADANSSLSSHSNGAYPLSPSDADRIAKLHGGRVPTIGQLAPPDSIAPNQTPIINTGNIGPMQRQQGDWTCECGFVNWRRRKICLRCFPFAHNLANSITMHRSASIGSSSSSSSFSTPAVLVTSTPPSRSLPMLSSLATSSPSAPPIGASYVPIPSSRTVTPLLPSLPIYGPIPTRPLPPPIPLPMYPQPHYETPSVVPVSEMMLKAKWSEGFEMGLQARSRSAAMQDPQQQQQQLHAHERARSTPYGHHQQQQQQLSQLQGGYHGLRFV